MSSQQTPIITHSVETPSGRIGYASAGSGPVALRLRLPRVRASRRRRRAAVPVVPDAAPPRVLEVLRRLRDLRLPDEVPGLIK